MLGRASPQAPPYATENKTRQVQGMDGGSQQARKARSAQLQTKSTLPESRGVQSLHLRIRRQYIPASRDNKHIEDFNWPISMLTFHSHFP